MRPAPGATVNSTLCPAPGPSRTLPRAVACRRTGTANDTSPGRSDGRPPPPSRLLPLPATLFAWFARYSAPPPGAGGGPPGAGGPTRGRACPGGPAPRGRRCPGPPGVPRASSGTDTPQAPPLGSNTRASDGRDATAGRSPGGLVRIGLLLLHRLVGLGAHPDAGMRNRDHEAVAHPQRPRLVGGERLPPLGRQLSRRAQGPGDGGADPPDHRVLHHIGERSARRIAQLGERDVPRRRIPRRDDR